MTPDGAPVPAGIAEEQAALRRVAMLVARGAAPEVVFASVAEEAAGLLDADVATINELKPDGEIAIVAGHGLLSPRWRRRRFALRSGLAAIVPVWQTGRAVRFEPDDLTSLELPEVIREEGIRSSVNAGILVEGRIWGLMGVGSRRGPLAPATEQRLVSFTELTAIAIASAQASSELRAFAEEQAALSRVAMLAARGAAPDEVFMSVTEEAGRILDEDFVVMSRFDPDGTMLCVASWCADDFGHPPPSLSGVRWQRGGRNVQALVLESGQSSRLDDYDTATGEPAEDARALGLRAAVGVPIWVEGRLWGAMAALSRSGPLAAATEETGRLLGTDHAWTAQYNPDYSRTLVSTWSRAGTPTCEGSRAPLGGQNVHTLVFETGRAARIDGHADASGVAAEDAWTAGLRTSVAVPISIDGRLWGAMGVGSTRDSLPADTETRLARFTELAATAIANAEARAALTASRARIVAAADAARQRIERDLHDVAHERLVSLVRQLRAAQAAAPEAGDLVERLESVIAEANDVLEQLREIARGLHPSDLAEGGLRPALTVLVRRSAVPVKLVVRVAGRLPESAEMTAYYAVSEALANTAKHAHAAEAEVEVSTKQGMLLVRVRDDGQGGADFGRGSGLAGLRDRVEAVGGRISLRSQPEVGTTVEIELPLRGPAL